jgi:FtsH-binding integral membrane protein
MFVTLDRTASDINSAMARVYAHMSLAVVTSMLVSYLIGSSPELVKFFFTGVMHWVVIFAPLVAIFFIVPAIGAEPPKPVAFGLLHLFAGIMGLSISVIFAVYAGSVIFTAFMGAAVLFATLSFYGYFTKRSLDDLGSFLFVGLIAIIIASLINIFVGSTVMQMVISAIGILIFLGFTAYDTQKIREQLMEDDSTTVEVLGALTLYLDFINLFLNLLQILGFATGNDD